ncbi:hypothetical protein OF83DRAFT_1051510 [Amylostereum chailletii]|nr:hypothetical protein OF83DRAFT_1051510 [Amylostereum chailletii]
MPFTESPVGFSPTSNGSTPTTTHPRAQTYSAGVDPALLTPQRQRDSDAVSISSTASGRKRRLWRRGSVSSNRAPSPAPSPKRKPTGLASAIASTGMSMASPTVVMPPLVVNNNEPARPGPPSPVKAPTRSGTNRSPALNYGGMHTPNGSIDGHTANLTNSPDRIRSNSLGMPRYDGDGGDDSSGEDEDEDDAQLLADLADEIPVTGFAVASNKRNADFHEMFPTVPEGDYLIEDYGCALQRDILIQGRLYISEHHICFHANIFGWITDLIIPIYEIISLEKKMTAFVIPNALQLTTRTAKYNFASFLARDTVYDIIFNIRKLERPDDGLGDDAPQVAEISPPGMSPASAVAAVAGSAAIPMHKVTQCACGKEGKHFSELALESVFPGTPDRIYNLMFASGFMKDFMRENQKLEDIQVSDWAPSNTEPICLGRNMSYIKPLNGSIGPRQTKCEIRDETVHSDFEDYVSTMTTTRTPDVPSGGVFSVKTRTCIMWASSVSTRVVVTSEVQWTGRSFIKGIIERSAIEGQKTYHADLDKAMRAYIQEHKTEFIPAGVDAAAIEAVQAPELSSPPTPSPPTKEGDTTKARERERNRRGLQWAYDTFEGAYGVAKQSTTGALELIRDAWDNSDVSVILWFVIVFLVISNIWTIMLVGRREEAGRRKEMRKTEEREKWVQGIVTALWDELAAGRQPNSLASAPEILGTPTENIKREVTNIHKVLDAVEIRVKAIRESLDALD